MSTFTVNGKKYNSAEVTFLTICELEKMGVSVFNIGSRGYDRDMTTLAAYLAFCSGMSFEDSAMEINEDVSMDGDAARVLGPISRALTEEVNASGFFQAIKKRAEAKNRAIETEAIEAEVMPVSTETNTEA